MGINNPYTQTFYANVQPVATVGNSLLTIVGKAPFPGRVTSVKYTPGAAQAGANTNSRTLNLYNRGTGAGSTVIATLPLVSGTNLTDNVETAIPVTAANANVASGDILEWESLAVGTGIADPGGMVEIIITRNW